MDQAQVDKRTKEYKEQQAQFAKSQQAQTATDQIQAQAISFNPGIEMPKPTIKDLIDIGIMLSKVVFHKSVVSMDGQPEYAFYSPGGSSKANRLAEIWYTPHGVVIKQRMKTKEGYKETHKLLPLAQVADTEVL